MSNTITVNGFVCDNIHRYDNDDGSVKILFTVSSRTQDPKRWTDKKERDFWNCELYLPKSRTRLADFIKKGSNLTVGGIPYKAYSGDGDAKKEYARIRVMTDMVQFIGSKEDSENGGNSDNSANQNQNQNSNQSNQNSGAQSNQGQSSGGNGGW